MSRKSSVSLIGALAICMTAGCGSSQMSRIDRNRDVYETWPIEVRQAVLDGKVEQGMTPEMVEVSWGRPTEVVSQGNTGDEIWVYKIGGDDGMYPGPIGGVYPRGSYPGGYPGGGYPGSPGGIVIGTGSGMGGRVGVGVGGGGMGYPGGGMGYPGGGMGYPGAGMGGPIMTRPTPPEIREVVFRNGVVHRADNPTP